MSRRINTALTKKLNIDIPIISAPMAEVATPALACAVTASGALGLIGAGLSSTKDIVEDMQLVRSTLNIPSGQPLPLGFGFLGWALDRTEVSSDPRLPGYLDQLPKLIWLAFGTDLGKYVKFVQEYEANRAHKTLIFLNVGSVADAIRAAEWGVDFIVAQGIEAGGHASADAPPTLTLLQAIITALPNGPPIIAAGGIMTGKQIAALLTMGAAGVNMGTRFLFTEECSWGPEKKQVLIKAEFNSTVRSVAFDEVAKNTGWPDRCDGRAVANDIIKDKQEGLDLKERVERYTESSKAGEESRLIIWAGVGVGLANTIQKASDVVAELHAEILHTLESARALLVVQN